MTSSKLPSLSLQAICVSTLNLSAQKLWVHLVWPNFAIASSDHFSRQTCQTAAATGCAMAQVASDTNITRAQKSEATSGRWIHRVEVEPARSKIGENRVPNSIGISVSDSNATISSRDTLVLVQGAHGTATGMHFPPTPHLPTCAALPEHTNLGDEISTAPYLTNPRTKRSSLVL
eukprot:291279-Amphidinium_carterae.1